jgi:hypothetical protein
MQHKFFILFYALCVFSLSCQKQSDSGYIPQKLRTMDQVKAIAATYGLDSLATEEKNSGLQFFPETDLHAYFKQAKHTLDSRQENKSFLERTLWVNSFSDYMALIDSLPITKQDMIKSHGGPEKHQQWIESMRKTKWHVYRLPQGGIGFEYPDRDNKEHPGSTRMDK